MLLPCPNHHHPSSVTLPPIQRSRLELEILQKEGKTSYFCSLLHSHSHSREGIERSQQKAILASVAFSSVMAKHKSPKKPTKQMNQNQNLQPPKSDSSSNKPPSWAVMRGIFACKDLQTQQQTLKQDKKLPEQKQKQEKQKQQNPQQEEANISNGDEGSKKQYKKMKCSGSLCSNTKVMHRPELSASPEAHKRRALASSSSSSHNNDTASSSRSMKAPLRELSTNSSFSTASSSNSCGTFRAMPFRRFSGCYECRMVVDPVLGFTRDPSLRATICSCPECGEIFMKPENLELHQAVRHAVSELGPDDTSKNIVEIIFQSSWLKKQTPICKIDRILKVQNTQRTITRFEEYRDAIKSKATRLAKTKHPRCVADGNELLRFHSTTFACSLGLNGSSNLCNSIPQCRACTIIKSGFRLAGDDGILTTATSGKAHDKATGDQIGAGAAEKRAMLVCRVIAGRVRKSDAAEGTGAAAGEEYDSVGGGGLGVYSNLDELYVFNPKAILPCFVVIYTGF